MDYRSLPAPVANHDFFGGHSRFYMKMKCFVPVLLALLLLLAFPTLAEEDYPEDWDLGPATPTDLACAHEHTEAVYYFYDSPSYTPMDENIHKVSGTAYVEVRCLDCGEILITEEETYAEEIRPHTFKNNACPLCGFRLRVKETEPPAAGSSASGSGQALLHGESSASGLESFTLSNADLAEMESGGVVTALARPARGRAAVALDVKRMQAQTRTSGMNLCLDLLEQEDGSFFVGLWLEKDGKKLSLPDKAGVTLRFYEEKTPPLQVTLSPSGSDELREADAVWNDGGFWSVTYQAEGTYFLKQ